MSERRLHQRFQKQYTAIFYLKDNPQETYDMPTILDISRGGLKFISSHSYPPGTKVCFNIKFPFLYPASTTIEGEVVAVDQGIQSESFKIKAKFINVGPEVGSILRQMEVFNLKKSSF